MSYITIPGGSLLFPQAMIVQALRGNTADRGLDVAASAFTTDATDEKYAMMGRVHIDGRPSAAKTISSSGGKIHFRTGAVTWATSGTTLRIGIQDLDNTTGPNGTPDGTFDVYDDIVQGTDSLSANTWTTITMSSGTKSIAHGDLIAVVFDLTTRNGSDSVAYSALNQTQANHPLCRGYTTSWQNPINGLPLVVIEFDDGTLATILGSLPFITYTLELFSDSTNPDERGLIFQVPFACQVEGCVLSPIYFGTGANSDCDITLYETPLGTPNALATKSILAENMNTTESAFFLLFSSPAYLKSNTDYCLAIKATGASNVGLRVCTLPSAASRCFIDGGTNLRKGTRNNGSGAFSEDTTNLYVMGVLISAVDAGPSPSYQLGL